MLSKDHIVECALREGFTLCGVARARTLDEHRARFEAALAASVGSLPYLSRGFERRLDPSCVLSGARSVVVCALAYPFRRSASGVASYALMEQDYHVRIKRMLRAVLDRLSSRASRNGDEGSEPLRGKVCCDTAPILEKAWAVEAGLGWQGRNSLIINPLHGSFMCLGEIVLDAEVDAYDEPFTDSGCGSCRACIDACPVGALAATSGGGAPRQANAAPVVPSERENCHPERAACGDEGSHPCFVDTSRCISSLTNELPRLTGSACAPIHGWIRGCDECQIACPHNRLSIKNQNIRNS